MDFKGFVNKLKGYVGKEDEPTEPETLPQEQEIEDLRFKKLAQKMREPTKSDFYAPEGDHPEDTYLKHIARLESSDGKDTDHRVMQSGLHAGDAAIGKYGIMPKTAKDISAMFSNKHSDLRKKLGENYYDPEVESLQKMKDEDIKKKLTEDPEFERRLARYFATRLNSMEGDETDKVYRWKYGQNLKKEDINPTKRDSNEYIVRYKKLLKGK
jgi:hypothetical protein